jgi:hypothetical protein
MNRGLSRVALPRTARRAPGKGLLRSIASKGEGFAAGAQGAPDERSQRPVPPLDRGQPPSGGQPLTAPTRFCAYAVALIGVTRLACRKPRNASRPRSRPASTIAYPANTAIVDTVHQP